MDMMAPDPITVVIASRGMMTTPRGPRGRRAGVAVLFGVMGVLSDPGPTHGQQPFSPPADISFRTASIISEGTRIHAEVYAPGSAAPTEKLPTIIMGHGWGGVAANLRNTAPSFARAGYLVVVFDYRGWGGSDSRVILATPPPPDRPNNRFTAEVREVREVVDPIDQLTDWLNVIHWVHGEQQADPSRIGLWGSSYSGGLVVSAAARDRRVKALVSQVGAMGTPGTAAFPEEARLGYDAGTKRTRGEITYPPPRAKEVGNLVGGPIREKMLYFSPAEDVEKVTDTAMLFIVAEKEELFDNREHANRAHARAKAPTRLVAIPDIAHYGIYTTAREQATKLAIEWFDEYLKSPTGPREAADARDRFIGHWRLVKFENFDEKGVARDAGYESGRILYDAAGNMSAQLMRAGRMPLSQPSTEAERAAAYSTFVAYYGKYTIDPSASKVTHAVEGALNTNWVKTDLVRYYQFSADGRQLMLSLRNAEGRVTGTLTWARMP
jgi:uncharacterized protein